MSQCFNRTSCKSKHSTFPNQRQIQQRNKNILQTNQKQKMDKMYQDNMKLGYKINSLADQNNFYRIQINNIKKLNQNINKDLNRFIASNSQASKSANYAKSDNYIESMLISNNTTLGSTLDIKAQTKNSALNQVSASKYPNVLKHSINKSKLTDKDSIKIERSTIGQKNIINYFGYQSSVTTPMNYNQYFCENQRNQYNNNVTKIRSRNAYTRSINSFHHNMKYKNEINNANAVEPLFNMNNRIKLKNLQLKVGNSIRQAQKLKKQYEGSLSTLSKRTVCMQEEINQHTRKLEKLLLENQMLSNIYLADHYECFYKQLLGDRSDANDDFQLAECEKEIRLLQSKQIQLLNRVEHLKKEQKGYKKVQGQMGQQIRILSGEVQIMRKQNPQSIQIKQIRAVQIVQLQRLQAMEKRLWQKIEQQDAKLQEQYRLNLEYKQKIVDRNQQQNKQIKVLQQEVNKCQEQVKQIKQKHRDLINYMKTASFATSKLKKKPTLNFNK